MWKWILDFELIASCNGIKGSAHLFTALGTLLSGRARTAYDLNLESNQALDYGNLKAALVAEFSKEGDREKAMDRFYVADCRAVIVDSLVSGGSQHFLARHFPPLRLRVWSDEPHS
ncbi:unnamed protein product [Echinostoma caproni]|uniref:ThiF domain-containing protein n=1 Tax=Echinostoma caproni TaxID=27848 RepID=A0A183B5C8_9TREM|nr:unnamed protein product [Echinostoma caproni]